MITRQEIAYLALEALALNADAEGDAFGLYIREHMMPFWEALGDDVKERLNSVPGRTPETINPMLGSTERGRCMNEEQKNALINLGNAILEYEACVKQWDEVRDIGYYVSNGQLCHQYAGDRLKVDEARRAKEAAMGVVSKLAVSSAKSYPLTAPVVGNDGGAKTIYWVSTNEISGREFSVKDFLAALGTSGLDPLTTDVFVDIDRDPSGDIVGVKLHCSDSSKKK